MGKMKIAYFDLSSGISGDMLLGALLDLGASEKVLNNVIDELGLENVNVLIEDRGDPLRGKDVKIKYKDQPHRRLSTIIDMIEDSGLNDFVKEKSVETFELLGEAEAKV
ncbi:MAG: nickel insertion protein, partial [Thermoplasmatota archaeon]